jgi:hypothetical protein
MYNRLAEALLEAMPRLKQRYSTAVLVCKNKEYAKVLIDKFIAVCTDEKIALINGCEAIINNFNMNFCNDKNLCVMFEDLQFIAEIAEYEQRFFDIYNVMFEKSVPILITISDNPRCFPFEERNICRLSWGITAEIL